jgi:hypothetical protein
MLLVNVLSQLINTYWFTLIVEQVKRNVKKFMNRGKAVANEEEYVDAHTGEKVIKKSKKE